MDLLHQFLNINVLPPLTFIALLLLMPTFGLLKFLFSLKRYIYIENVAGKVALITGASSGIGEHVAYEYARRGARLVLVARRVDRLQVVADKARQIGSLEVIVVAADVSKVEDCKRFVEEAVNHTLDNDINFWGSVYSTHYAIPYLRKSKGKIVVISSTAALLTSPRFSFYNASKAALISFFETLRTEFDPDIGITIVTPRLIESEMTKGEILSQYAWVQVEATEVCAKAIVDSACSGDMYLTEPPWVKGLNLILNISRQIKVIKLQVLFSSESI
ncbi:11-beta-hydroxysteroid dehydrogenase-like 2 [Quercus suber]|uniref:11-beta-hydroxysteroid dehydrogenase-like 2 n=1 Tax=Quercus suber TaxID=58331 RepID=UPI0032DE8D74